MERSLLAVIIGTFTLRLSTGLTGGMLVFYLADLHRHGGPVVDPVTVGMLGALFYAAELVGSSFFGILSDRWGHHRVMQVGPAFGAIAVIITGLSSNITILGSTRILEGLSTAASVPSILGFIAFATAGNETLRGRAVARFEAATLAGLMAGFVLAGILFRGLGDRLPFFQDGLGPSGFFLNAILYGVSFAIYRYGVSATAEPDPLVAPRARPDRRSALRRYASILRGSHVWLLAPTWIAINATLGLFTGQTLFQLINARDPRFGDQLLMGSLDGLTASLALGAGGLLFFIGIFYWGRRFAKMRRTTIILYGIFGGALMLAAGAGINHSAGFPGAAQLGLTGLAIAGLFVLAGATPAAIGLLADVTEAYPDDRGAIMGLYSVFLGVGQIIGNLVGGESARAFGLDGIFVAALGLLLIALVPLFHLRRYESHVGGQPRRAALGADEPAG